MDHLPKLITHICPDSEVAKSLKCSRTKATSLTKYCLAKEQLEIISRKLKQTKFSLILDETTDISTEKSLALVVRFFDEGVVKDRFFGLLKVESCTAEAIFNKILDYLIGLDIPLDNLLGLAADNAAVMMGQLTGVQARFKDRLPNLFVLGCVCHSFHLCSSAATKKLPRSLENFVRNIYNYFSNSSQRLSKLKECQTFMSLKPNKLLHPSRTRWLSLQARTVERFTCSNTFDSQIYTFFRLQLTVS
ncbi:hypothetical protein NQ314_010279 [Rhamnusium bicolor]|uniref:DUF4371 domain-containing protein n=1 Tax=Rhamnusium bicolor TaxID=1586634 RepID=A0AAV8XT32_9CUCU|nr:hypothetical protein NQ314_010279 [Rhamnusium bicolor]